MGIQFTEDELTLIGNACYQLLEILETSRGRWEKYDSTRDENEQNMETLQRIISEIDEEVR